MSHNINFVVTIIIIDYSGLESIFLEYMVNDDSELRERISGLVPAFKSA